MSPKSQQNNQNQHSKRMSKSVSIVDPSSSSGGLLNDDAQLLVNDGLEKDKDTNETATTTTTTTVTPVSRSKRMSKRNSTLSEAKLVNSRIMPNSWVAQAQAWAPTALKWGANVANLFKGTVSDAWREREIDSFMF
jgi:hypothetical protein